MNDIIKIYPPSEYVYSGSITYKKRLYPKEYKNGKKHIFATDNIYLAISYIRKHDAMIAQNDEKGIVMLMELVPNEFKKIENDGYLYILDKSKFDKSRFKNLKTEFVSNKIQKPVDIILIKNPLNILKNTDKVVLFYRSKNTF